MLHSEKKFIRAKMKGVHIYECYVSLSAGLNEHEQMLRTLVLNARGRGSVIIAGDFIALALE